LNNQDIINIIADKNISKVDFFSSVFAKVKVITTIAFITCAGNFYST
jgi:hypothetical protein